MKNHLLIFLLTIFTSCGTVKMKETEPIIRCIINETYSESGEYSITVFNDKTYNIIFGEAAIGKNFFIRKIEDTTLVLSEKDYNQISDLIRDVDLMSETKKESHVWDATEVYMFTRNKSFFFYLGDQDTNYLGGLYQKLTGLSPISMSLKL